MNPRCLDPRCQHHVTVHDDHGCAACRRGDGGCGLSRREVEGGARTVCTAGHTDRRECCTCCGWGTSNGYACCGKSGVGA